MNVKRIALLAPLLTAACATPLPLRPAAEGTVIALNGAVHVGKLIARPLALAEDSRCPQNVRCVWAGQVIVTTRIDGDGWHETARLTLGQRHPTHGTWIMLASAQPEKRADAPIPTGAYRFTFEGGF